MRLEVRGRVVRGAGQAASFTDLDWVREEFRRKLGFDPYSGTLNIQVAGAEAQAIYRLAKEAGIAIEPAAAEFCVARCLRAQVSSLQVSSLEEGAPSGAPGPIRGAVIVPLVEHYYEDIVEVMAPAKITEALGLADGQELRLEVWD